MLAAGMPGQGVELQGMCKKCGGIWFALGLSEENTISEKETAPISGT
jgi:hypothetical protein